MNALIASGIARGWIKPAPLYIATKATKYRRHLELVGLSGRDYQIAYHRLRTRNLNKQGLTTHGTKIKRVHIGNTYKFNR